MDETLSSSSSIQLIVKASNQQYDDQTINCQLNWTVRKLKEHLSDVYPSKPKPDDQKLIYSGQLLRDKLILKDIIRHYEGVQSQVHTFHLVCTPPRVRFPTAFGSLASHQQQQQPKSNQQQTVVTSAAGNNEGLRQRHNIQQRTSSISTATTINQNQSSVSTTAASSFTQNNSIPQMAGITGTTLFPVMNNNCPTSSSLGSTGSAIGNNISSFSPILVPNEYTLAQQAAMQNWMQQAYIQYINQYMSLLSTGIRPETIFMQNQPITTEATTGTTMNVGGLPQMPYLPQYFPSTMMNANFSSNLTTNSSITTHPPIINPLSSSSSTTATTAAIPPSVIQQQQQQQQHQPQPQQNQPRFPNIIQNDLQENRDWLDIFYSISRLMVLLTLVYLYSSPIRCFSVFVIGMAIYLYHRAYYYDNNNNNNNNNGAQAQVRRPQQNVEQQQQNVQSNNENIGTADTALNETNSLDSTRERTSGQENSTENATNDANSSSTSERETNTGTAAVSNAADDPDGTSMIAFLKTFVVSFLVSLFPEAPPV